MNELADRHRDAICLMQTLAQAVLTSCNNYSSNRQAIEKARLLELKTKAREEAKQAKKAEKEAQREAAKAAKQRSLPQQ